MVKIPESFAIRGQIYISMYIYICTYKHVYIYIYICIDPPTDGKDFTTSENLKSCQGPVLKCRGSRKRRASYLNELVIQEIRNNASAIFQNFLFSKIEFVQCGKNP